MIPYIVLKNLETLFFTFHVLGVNRTFKKNYSANPSII